MKFKIKLKRTIDFRSIVDRCEIVADTEYRRPWDECCGFEHTTRRADRSDENRAGYAIPDRGGAVLIELDDTDSTYRFWRANGASKQFAYEKQAADNAARLAQIVDWYENGWEWFGVKCQFKGEHASVWGIDTYKYAEECKLDIALEIASQLEKRGFRIVGKPQPSNVRHSRGFYLLNA